MICTVWTCEPWGGGDCVMIYRYNSDRITFVTGQCMPACESTQRTCLYSSHIEAIETVKWYKCEIPRYARSVSTQSVNLLKARISAFQLIWRLSISAVNHGWWISVQRCISSCYLQVRAGPPVERPEGRDFGITTKRKSYLACRYGNTSCC